MTSEEQIEITNRNNYNNTSIPTRSNKQIFEYEFHIVLNVI